MPRTASTEAPGRPCEPAMMVLGVETGGDASDARSPPPSLGPWVNGGSSDASPAAREVMMAGRVRTAAE